MRTGKQLTARFTGNIERNGTLETNDCTVRCLQKLTGWSYQDAHAYCAARGRKPCSGFNFAATLESIGGKQIEQLKWKRLSLTQLMKMPEMSSGDYAIITHNHTFAIIEGVIYDNNARPINYRCDRVYKIIPKDVTL